MKPARRAALIPAFSLIALGFCSPGSAFAQSAVAPSEALTVEVGGAPMYPSKNIIENADNSKDHTMLVTAVKAAGLVETLEGDGPFTVFAPVNKAFERLPKGAIETLLKPENKDALAAVLTYHVLPGKYSASDFIAAIKKGGGKATFKTVEGEDLIVQHDGRRLELIDGKGDKSFVTISDVNQKNGVVHVVDAVLMPKN